MLHPSLYAEFVATVVVVLMLSPGPNVALIVANSVAYGPTFGFLIVSGTALAMVVQLAFTAFGMSHLLGALGAWFEWLRWVGVAYLVCLGISQRRAAAPDLARTRPEPKSKKSIVARAFLVSLTNPKTLLFYGAFFPQFIDPARDPSVQVAILALTFLAVAIVLDGCWAMLAGRARQILAIRAQTRNRLSGSLLMGAGAAPAFARHK